MQNPLEYLEYPGSNDWMKGKPTHSSLDQLQLESHLFMFQGQIYQNPFMAMAWSTMALTWWSWEAILMGLNHLPFSTNCQWRMASSSGRR